jgi:lysophospholipase L1-like esterase
MIRSDLRAEPVRRLVVMGESNAYGMCASAPANEWVQVLANGIRRFQAEPVRVFNNAIPANVISPDAPGYEPGRFGTWPSASERFERDMIAYAPDMAVYAYGLNDSRCGHSVESFMAAYRAIVARTREALPDALIVLVGPYWNLQYDAGMWATPKYRNWIFGKFDRAGDDLVIAYNREIAALADEVGGLFVDLYATLEGAAWLLNADACHFNDVGQAIIGNRVFCEVAAHCSFLAAKSREIEKKLHLSTRNTGGTEALAEVVNNNRKPEGWSA